MGPLTSWDCLHQDALAKIFCGESAIPCRRGPVSTKERNDLYGLVVRWHYKVSLLSSPRPSLSFGKEAIPFNTGVKHQSSQLILTGANTNGVPVQGGGSTFGIMTYVGDKCGPSHNHRG